MDLGEFKDEHPKNGVVVLIFWGFLFILVALFLISSITIILSHDQNIVCVPNPSAICTEEYAPVCGVDHKTYTNMCDAARLCVEVSYEGPCENTD